MRLFRICIATLVLTVFSLSALVGSTRFVSAEDAAPACILIQPDDLTAAKEACDSGDPNSICFGTDTIDVKMSGASTFAKQGDQLDLATVDAVTTSISDSASGNGGIALLNMQAGLPDGKGITAVLYGDATLTSKVNPDAATMPTVAVEVNGGNTVLLRGGAGPNYPSGLSLKPGITAVADGRNKAASWLRVRTENGVGWALASLLKITGDAAALLELDEHNTQADFLYTTPMQAFTLASGAGADPTAAATTCGAVPSGLLLQNANDEAAKVLVNGADVTFNQATLVVRSMPRDRLEIAVITGSANVSALGSTQTVEAGKWVRIRLGGTDGITPIAQPPQALPYAFAMVDGAPVELLGKQVDCTVGLPANTAATTKVSVRVGPGEERGPLFFMKLEENFKVSGKANDSEGAPWWQIVAEGRKEAWVSQAEVHAVGSCDQIADVPPPPVIVAIPDEDDIPASTDPDTTVSQGFAPTAISIWNAEPGPITSTGTCSGVPTAYCAQLVALTPRGTGFLWKGQELKPYFMVRIRENVYAYAGPNILGDADIKLTLAFTSPTTFSASQSMVMRNQKGCTNSFTFTGTFVR